MRYRPCNDKSKLTRPPKKHTRYLRGEGHGAMFGRLTAVVFISLFAAGIAPAGDPSSFPKLAWSVDKRIPSPLHIFPSPADPDVVFVSSEQGLWRTRDNAATWELIP